jgi:taurine--2-oxoglutarate transaminase
MNGEEITRLNRQYTLFSWSVQAATNPIPVTRAQGVYFWDADNKQYLDFCSGLVYLNLGHQHPAIVKAIQEQAGRLCCIQPAMATEPRGKLGQMLVHVAPPNLKKVFFCLGGADANENAMKMARMYTKRNKFIARYKSYHGSTLGAAALSGDPRRVSAEPTAPGVVHMLDPFCYRCPFGQNPATCHRECLMHSRWQVVQYEGPETIAAIFMEGVTGSVNGTFVPPDDYWPSVREICDKHGILLVADEVMSGFGRTGKWFAINHWDIEPDMMTMAKGITCGYVPMGAVMVSGAIADAFENRMLSCGLTYSSHTLACAAGCASLQAYKDEGVIENSARMGRILGECLEDMKARHRSVGDVRSIGLFSAIELVKDRVTKEPLVVPTLAKVARERGLSIMAPANMISITPPLIISEAQLRDGLKIVDGLLDIADGAVS